jgi:predicted ArsR family transcriptional regulator
MNCTTLVVIRFCDTEFNECSEASIDALRLIGGSEAVREWLRRRGSAFFTMAMWTSESRGRMAQIAAKTKRYPSD